MFRKCTVVASVAFVATTGLVTGASADTADPVSQSYTTCEYVPTPDDPPARPVPPPSDKAPDHGTTKVKISTNHGSLPLTLDRERAPCTAHSFAHLARHHFYDWTRCHRLTTYPTLEVLQCGDPSGTGAGGPGYRYADELPVGLEPAPNDPSGERKIYPRGTLAMANAGPDTNGSQFFLVYGNAYLMPDYTIFGTIGTRGLATVDRVAAGGVEPTPDDPEPVDGPPARPTHLFKVKVRH